MARIIFHIDVNSAYLSWEAAERIKNGDTFDLRSIPSAVGGDEAQRHGVVLAKSIPAKKYGVQTGESLYAAKQKCPHLVVVPPRHKLYKEYSHAMRELVARYSPVIENFSIDELFMEYMGVQGQHLQQALEIKERMKSELGFTVNIGISENKILAKMASDFEKPDKIHTLFKDEIQKKIWPLDVGKLLFVGRNTKARLNSRGIYTIGQLAQADENYMYKWLKKQGRMIWRYANGIDDSPVHSQRDPAKSISSSVTTGRDLMNRAEVEKVLYPLCKTVNQRLIKERLFGYTLSVSYKNFNFISYSKQQKFSSPLVTTEDIFRFAMILFDKLWKGDPIRLVGVGVSDLTDDSCYQLSLFSSRTEKDLRVDRAIEEIRKIHGSDSIYRGFDEDFNGG